MKKLILPALKPSNVVKPADAVAYALSGLHRQQGVALISVMLIFAIAAALAARMMINGAVQVEQASVYLQQQRVMTYAQGVESYVIALLKDDWDKDNQQGPAAFDHPQDSWAQLKRFPLDEFENEASGESEGEILLRAEPLNGLFNLGNIINDKGEIDPAQVNIFRQILVNQQIPTEVADLTIDWMDTDNTTNSLLGAEDNNYLLKSPAYRTADQRMVNLSELALLDKVEVTPELQAKLEQDMVVLPTVTKVNLNWAKPEILALVTKSSPGQAEQWLVGLEFTPITNVKEFLTKNNLDEKLESVLTTRSEYFRIRIRVNISGQLAYITSIVHRQQDDGSIMVLQRNFLPFNKAILKLEEEQS